MRVRFTPYAYCDECSNELWFATGVWTGSIEFILSGWDMIIKGDEILIVCPSCKAANADENIFTLAETKEAA